MRDLLTIMAAAPREAQTHSKVLSSSLFISDRGIMENG